MNSRVLTSVARLFVAVPIPAEVRTRLRSVLDHYQDHLQSAIPEERWHLTFLFLGTVPNVSEVLADLTPDLPQLFVPTVMLTHLGVGKAPFQLWAYAQPSTALANVRLALCRRANRGDPARALTELKRSFVPHVRLASLKRSQEQTMLAASPLTVTFAVRQLHIYRSELDGGAPRYETVGITKLAP
jgi:2'-5' RNA ligase